jgi:hypothetical protein
MEKNRCKKYEGKDTFGLGKDYVYKKCKRCPSTKAFDPSPLEGRPDFRTVYDACKDEKIYLRGLEIKEKRKKEEQEKKERGNCVSLKPSNHPRLGVNYGYGKHIGYPCKGTKDEKLYRLSLKNRIKLFQGKLNPDAKNQNLNEKYKFIIKVAEKEIEKLDDFYKGQKEDKKKDKKNKTKRKKKKRTKRIKKGGASCQERPYFSDPLKEGVVAPESPLLRRLNPPLEMVLPNANRFQNRVKHHGQDCLCGLELNRVMNNIEKKWSRMLMIEQEKNNYLEDQVYHLQRQNQNYKRNYIRMTPEMVADPLYLHGDEQIPHSLSSSSKRRRSSRKSC